MKLVGWSVLVTDTKTKNKEVRGCGYALSYENGCATIPYVCLQHEQLELSELLSVAVILIKAILSDCCDTVAQPE